MRTPNLRRLLLLGSIVMLPFPVYGATYTIGTPIESGCGGACDFDIIQDALDDTGTAAGDVFYLYPGTYFENLTIGDAVPEVTLMRAPVAGVDAVINGSASAPVITINGGQGSGLVIQGIRLTNGQGWDKNSDGKLFGGGIYLENSSPTLEDLMIDTNTGTFGGGIYMLRASPILRHVRVDGNTVVDSGVGSSGAGVYLHFDSHPTFEDCVISDNSGAVRGGGFYIYGADWPEIKGSKITGNSAEFGGGLYVSSGAAPALTGTLIAGNTATGSQVKSTTPPGGGGVYLYDGAEPLFVNVTLAENALTGTGIVDGVELYSFGSNARFLNSVIYNASSSDSLLYGLDFTSGRSESAELELKYSDVCNWNTVDCSTYTQFAGAFSAAALPYRIEVTSASAERRAKFMEVDPVFVGGGDYHLDVGSTLIGSGHPATHYNDYDESRNDVGAYGGPLPVTELDDVSADGDRDGMSDAWENAYFGDTSRDGSGDYDSDSLLDADEYYFATDPTRVDTDRDGWYDADEASAAGSDPLDPTDHRPLAVSGRDRVRLTGETVTLDGTRSSDPDGSSLSYLWELMFKPGGSSATLTGGSTDTATFTPDVAGRYIARLTVTDTADAPASVAASHARMVTVFVGTAGTDDLLVPSEHGTIQAAINSRSAYHSADDVFTVTVSDGTYNEDVDLIGRCVRLRSVNGAGTTTINGQSVSALTIASGEIDAVSVEGFTIQGGAGTTISGGLAGGGLLLSGTSPSIVDSIITSNSALNGGGVAIIGGQPFFNNVTIDGNTANTGGVGGGVYMVGAQPEFLYSDVTNNTATGGGGGDILGGGIYAYGSEFSFSGQNGSTASLSGNEADMGAGIYLLRGSRATFSWTDFDSNLAASHGGGMYLYRQSQVTASNVSLTNNSASTVSGHGGAAMLNDHSKIQLTSSSVGGSGVGNSAAYGAGMSLGFSSRVWSTSSSWTENTAQEDGGALYLAAGYHGSGSDSAFWSSTLESNSAVNGAGGAVFVTSNSRVNFAASGNNGPSELIGNSAASDGGGIAVYGGCLASVSNTLLLGNQANRGGGVYTYNSAIAYLDNVTMVGNEASVLGGAVATVLDETIGTTLVTIQNSIISNGARGTAVYGPTNISLDYTNMYNNSDGDLAGGVTAGGNVIALNPEYQSYNGDLVFTGEDFRLMSSSDCIDAGTPAGRDLGAYGNLSGEEQSVSGVVDSEPDGMDDNWEVSYFGDTTHDGSADGDGDGMNDLAEYNAGTDPTNDDSDADGVVDGSDSSPLDPTDNKPVARAGRDKAARINAIVYVNGSGSSDPNFDAMTFSWRFVSVPGGSARVDLDLAAEARTSFIPDVAGDYVLGLTVNDTGVDSDEDTMTIHASSPVMVGEGQTYTAIQSAIDAATSWDVILVKAGTYNEDLTIGSTPLTIVSESGPDSTTVLGTGTGSAVTFSSSPAGVVFSGFTVRGGISSSYGGGIYLNSSLALIEDNIVRNNSAAYGGGIFVNGGAPMLIRNQVVNNTATYDGGGIHLYRSNETIVMNNIISKNSGRYGGGISVYEGMPRIHFNDIIGNDATASAGNLHLLRGSADIRNNIIAYAVSRGGLNMGSFAGSLEYNLFFDNAWWNALGGTLDGSNIIDSDPNFNRFVKGISSSALLDDVRLGSGGAAENVADAYLYSYADPSGASNALPDIGAVGGPLADLSLKTRNVKASRTGDEVNTYFAAIMDAVQATISGETVNVYGGTYSEQVDFGGRDISMYGSLDTTSIIDGGGLGTTVTFENGESSAARLEGFVIRGGSGHVPDFSYRTHGGGLFIYNASPTISRCQIENNYAKVGGGIYLRGSSSVLSNIVVATNGQDSEPSLVTMYGGGIAIEDSDGLSIENALVRYNDASTFGGGIFLNSSTGGQVYDFVNVSLQENGGGKYGGGLFASNSDFLFENGIMLGNSVDAEGCTGGGAWINGGAFTVRNSIVTDNAVNGIYVFDQNVDATETVEYTLFNNNNSGYDHLIIFGEDTVAQTGNLLSAEGTPYDPAFTSVGLSDEIVDDLTLQEGVSPAIDAGNPSASYDDAVGLGAVTNDMGIYGGPLGNSWDLLL